MQSAASDAPLGCSTKRLHHRKRFQSLTAMPRSLGVEKADAYRGLRRGARRFSKSRGNPAPGRRMALRVLQEARRSRPTGNRIDQHRRATPRTISRPFRAGGIVDRHRNRSPRSATARDAANVRDPRSVPEIDRSITHVVTPSIRTFGQVDASLHHPRPSPSRRIFRADAFRGMRVASEACHGDCHMTPRRRH